MAPLLKQKAQIRDGKVAGHGLLVVAHRQAQGKVSISGELLNLFGPL